MSLFLTWQHSYLNLKKMQRYMDSEIRAIMAQYMPLDNQGEPPNHALRGGI